MRDSGTRNLTISGGHDPAATIRALSTSTPWPGLDPATKSTALGLAMHAGINGTATPTIEELSLYTGYSNRQVRQALTRLRRAGLVYGRIGRAGWRSMVLGDDTQVAVRTPLVVFIDRLGPAAPIAPFEVPGEVDSTDPLAVAEAIRVFAEMRSARHVQIDLDVHAGTGTILDGRVVLGEFTVAASEHTQRRSA